MVETLKNRIAIFVRVILMKPLILSVSFSYFFLKGTPKTIFFILE